MPHSIESIKQFAVSVKDFEDEEKERELEKAEIDQELHRINSNFGGAFNEEDYLDAPPDGGYGWVCTVMISVMNFSTWGANSAFSVFLAFFLESDYFPNATATDYALIGGLVPFLTLIVLPYSVIMLYKFGYKVTLSIAIIIQIAAYIGASFSKTIGQLYVTQGVLMGIAFGIMFGANSVVLPSWFLKKRALANGLSHAGLGLGGVTFSLSINALLTKTGNQVWPLRALGIITFVLCTISMVFVKIRTPKNATMKHGDKISIITIIKNIFDYKVWKSLPLQLATFWAMMGNFAYTICLFSLSNYVRSLGYTHDQATYVIVVFNIGQAFGRPLMGYLSEVFGRVNFSIFGTLYSCIMTFAIWPNLTAYYSLIIFALFLGLFLGVTSVNVVPLVVDVVGLDSYASAFSWTNTFMGISSLVAEVIALNLRDYSLSNPYFYCQMFTGAVYVVALIILFPYRAWKVNRMLYQMKDSKSLDEETRLKYEKLHEDTTIKGYFQKCFLWKKL